MSSSVPDAPGQSYPVAASPVTPEPVPSGPSEAPQPPPGPGVVPPFPAPPVEGRRKRLWMGLGIAGLALVLCCGGGLVAGIGLLVTSTQAINERAQVAVGAYLDDLREGRYVEAYQAQCPSLKRQETAGEFAAERAREPRITGYTLGDAQLTTVVTLPVTVRYADGGGDVLRFQLEQDTSTSEFRVCGVNG